MTKNISAFLFALLITVILAVSCASGPVTIPEDLTTAELIQRAQEASDRNRFSVALQYYETLIERFPNEIDDVIAAKYEIAFIHYKQKKYDTAKTEFAGVMEYYDSPDAALLPPQYRILSEKILATIEEIEEQKKPRGT